MSLLETIKGRLRTASDDPVLNADIMDDINAAKEELIRLGINPMIVEEAENPSIVRAVKTFVLANQTENQNDAEKYMESFKYQVDNLRKSAAYMVADDV